MNIIAKLDLLGKEALRRYPYLNNGGCCVYAAMIVQALHKHKINATGIVASFSADYVGPAVSIDTVRETITRNSHKQWNKNGVRFSHVGVEFEYADRVRTVKKHYDTAGVRDASNQLDGVPIYKGRLTIVELKALAGRKDGWNDMFDRKQIPELRKLVKSFLAVDRKKA
jgi:hypothetical protein